MPRPDESPQDHDHNPAERRFLNRLLDQVAQTLPDVHAALIKANPELQAETDDLDEIRRRVGDALSGKSGIPLSASEEAVAERIREQWTRLRAERDAAAERTGILTSMTRQLPPEKAMELYRKFAPVVVYQILDRVDQSTSLRVVHTVVDHLCSEQVQNRLRGADHVRDALIEELRAVLGAGESAVQMTRAELLEVLEESGAMNDLIAMENCLKLAASKAG